MNPHHFLITCISDVLNLNANRMKSLLSDVQRCLNHVFLLVQLKSNQGGKSLAQKQSRGSTIWKDMLHCDLANKKVEQLFKVSSPCLDDHQFKKEELESVGELSKVCSQIVLKCLYLARRHFKVCQQTCKSSHKMDSGSRQTFGKIDLVHSSHQ